MDRNFPIPEEVPIKNICFTTKSPEKNIQFGINMNDCKEICLDPKVLDEDNINWEALSEESISEESHQYPINLLMASEMLDIDNMTYEELLMLEEYIGSVSKGLTQKQIKVGIFLTFRNSLLSLIAIKYPRKK